MAIFSPPINNVGREFTLSQQTRLRKMKRKRLRADTYYQDQGDTHAASPGGEERPSVEYSAVVTPQERAQRRVAGQLLDQPVPEFPFPHSQASSRRKHRQPTTASSTQAPKSLRLQHLAALTAIVQRSVLAQDYHRAARALGLMFRDNSVVRGVTARNKGFMGIAAEVLLHQNQTDIHAQSTQFHVNNLDKAKELYQSLIIRHPYHKSWPESVNAVDFYLAMFNIWIHAVCATGQAQCAPDTPDVHTEEDTSNSKFRELADAKEIAAKMDECMGSLPYMDEPELIRLRAMVDLWMADLYETCWSFSNPDEQDTEHEPLSIADYTPSDHDYFQLATRSREQGYTRLSRLEGLASDSNDQVP